MSDHEQTVVRAEEDVSDGRTVGQEVASGRPAWTPFAALGSVFGVIAVLVVIVVALAALAYVLA
jgi:hypothetical protein